MPIAPSVIGRTLPTVSPDIELDEETWCELHKQLGGHRRPTLVGASAHLHPGLP